MNALPHPHRASAQTKLVALSILLAALAAIFLVRSDAALAGGGLAVEVGNEQASELGGSVALQVNGARRARSVALFVDGSLRKRDRSWPWSFGRGGRVGLDEGEHEIVVTARFRRKSQVRRATVQIADRRHHASIEGRKPGVSSNQKVGPQPAPPAAPAPTPPADPTETEWQGNFETGDLSQWDFAQQVAPDRITIAQDPVREGNYAARFEVRPGDNIGNTSPRAELGNRLHEQEGEERYYRWFTYFDPNFPTNYKNSFVTFTQWRAEDESDDLSAFMVWGDKVQLRQEGTRWSATLVKGVWHEFIFHVKWSPDPNVGFIELYYDGKLVMPKVYVETMAGTPGNAVSNYVKQGLYKADEIPTGVVYHDGFVAGESLDAVSGA